MPDERVASPHIRYLKFDTATRQISLRNIGVNTLWISFNKRKWLDVACGTSWDDRVTVTGFWYQTQTGMTSFVVVGLQLNIVEGFYSAVPTPTEEELAE